MDTFERNWAEKTEGALFESTSFPGSIPSVKEFDLKFSAITPIRAPNESNIPKRPSFSLNTFESTSSDIDNLAEKVHSLLYKEDPRCEAPESQQVSKDASKFQTSEILPKIVCANRLMSEYFNSHSISSSNSSLSSQDENKINHRQQSTLPPISFSTFLFSDKHKSTLSDKQKSDKSEFKANVDRALAQIHDLKANIYAWNEGDESSNTNSATIFNERSVETIKTNQQSQESLLHDGNNNPSLDSTTTSRDLKPRRSSTKIDNLFNDSIEYIPISPLKKTNNSRQIEAILKNVLQNDGKRLFSRIFDSKHFYLEKSSVRTSRSSVSTKSSQDFKSTKRQPDEGSSAQRKSQSVGKNVSKSFKSQQEAEVSQRSATAASSLKTNKQETISSNGSKESEKRSIDKLGNETGSSTKSFNRNTTSSSFSSLPQPDRTIQEQEQYFLGALQNDENFLKQVQKELSLFEKQYRKLRKEEKKVKFKDAKISSKIQETNAATRSKQIVTKQELENARILHQKAKKVDDGSKNGRTIRHVGMLCAQCGETLPKHVHHHTRDSVKQTGECQPQTMISPTLSGQPNGMNEKQCLRSRSSSSSSSCSEASSSVPLCSPPSIAQQSQSSTPTGHCYCCCKTIQRSHYVKSKALKSCPPPSRSTVAAATTSSSTSSRMEEALRSNKNNIKHNRKSTEETRQKSQLQSKRSTNNNDMARDDFLEDQRREASRASSASYVANVNRSVQTSIMIDNTPRPTPTPPNNSSSLFSGKSFFEPKKNDSLDSRRPIVYFLPLDSVPTKSPPRKDNRLRHSLIQVPVKSLALPVPELTIQEAFKQKCSGFRQRSAARVGRIRASAERRIETADQRRTAIAQSYAQQNEQRQRQAPLVKPTVIRTIPFVGSKKFDRHASGLTHREMRAQTEKIYKRLPEVKAADKWAKKEDEARRRRVMADIFKQRLKENAIRGKLNWPITTLAITAL